MIPRKQRALYFSVIVLLFILLVVAGYVMQSDNVSVERSRAEGDLTLQSVSSDLSHYEDSGSAIFYNLQSPPAAEGMYTLDSVSATSAVSFVSQKPSYTIDTVQENRPLVPSVGNLRLRKSLNDREIGGDIGLAGTETGNTHHYFYQTLCDDIPVFATYMNVHLTETSGVYNVSGALANKDASCRREISIHDAEAVAQETFREESSVSGTKIVQSEEYVYSPALFGQPEGNNSLTQFVEVCGDDLCRAYFVDLGNGTVRDSFQTSSDAKNRYVYLGSIQRKEGDPPVSNATVNEVYDILGDTYDYFKNTHNWDSYDNSGGMIQAQLRQCNQISASWDGRMIAACTGVVAADVISHEFQHGVTQYTAGLVYAYESGALNESLSDVTASIIDDNDWTMGEDSIRAIRSLENPPRFQHPDSLFSTYYYCGTGDNGGVHINSGVFNKAFYLMSDGGTFPKTNGCTLSGIGRKKAGDLVMKALFTYMIGKRTGNHRDMYDAVNSACNDLYQAGSAECQNVMAAMQAVSMDQQRLGQRTGPKCSGVSQKPLTCLNSTPPSPTTSPTSGPSPSVTVSPTTQPSPTLSPSTSPAPSVSPTITQEPTTTPEPTEKITADLLSTLSSPSFYLGSVTIEKGQQKSKLDAKLNLAYEQSLKLSDEYRAGALNREMEIPVYGRLIGQNTLETGPFYMKSDYTHVYNTFETAADLSQYAAYVVYVKGVDRIGDVPIYVANIQSPLVSDNTEKVVVNLQLRFQGIDKKPRSTQAMIVRVGIGGGDLPGNLYKKAVFTPDEQGYWNGSVSFDIKPSDDYAILIKGPKHIQKKYCDNNPSEPAAGHYLCTQNAVVLNRGANNLNYKNVMQLAGDINQDGIVNSVDIVNIRTSIGATNADDLAVGDVNHDGVINAIDDALVIFTLANRTDVN